MHLAFLLLGLLYASSQVSADCNANAGICVVSVLQTLQASSGDVKEEDRDVSRAILECVP